MSAIRDFLKQRLAAGAWSIGEVLARPDFSLRHVEDSAREDLEIFTRPENARELAKYDDAGNYRPLKTAPSLRHGWLLALSNLDQLQQALDFLYPAAVGTWLDLEKGILSGIPLRDTLNRQSGMYRVTQLITDPQAGELIQKVCGEGCIRHRLWNVNSVLQNPKSKIQHAEVLCAEACNLLVAACRPVAKQNLPKREAAS